MRADAIMKRLGEVLTGGERTPDQERKDEDARRNELAVLIDVENASPEHMDEVMRVAARYGEVTRRLDTTSTGRNEGSGSSSTAGRSRGSRRHVNTRFALTS